MSQTSLKQVVINTGRNVDDIVKELFKFLNDSTKEVKDRIHESICKIGKQEPLLVLSKGLSFLLETSKSNKTHRVFTMNVMSEVVNSNEIKMPEDLGKALVAFGVQEITSEKSINSEWQNAACVLLISLARLVPSLVAQELLLHFSGNTPPHYFIVKTLADFAHSYPVTFVPHLKEIMTRALPVLAMIKHDNLKWVFSAGLGRWAEAVIVAVNDKENPSLIPITEFAPTMATALKHLETEWLMQSTSKIRLACAEAIGYISHIVSDKELLATVKRMIPNFLTLLKRERNQQYAISTGLSNFIESVLLHSAESLETFTEVLLKDIHSYVCYPITGTMGKNPEENEKSLLRCIELITKYFTDRVITFLQKNVESTNNPVRLGTLKCFTHIVKSLRKELKDFRELIVGGIRLIVKTTDYPCRLELCKLISEMGKLGYLSSIGGNDLIMVIVRGCSIRDGTIEKFNQKTGGKKGITGPNDIREECDKILTMFSNSALAKRMDKLLWPFLFESFVDDKYYYSFGILCKVLSDIAKRKKNDEDFMIDFTKLVNIPKPTAIFSRLVVMLNKPYERNTVGVNILRALYCLSPLIHEELIDAWTKKLPEMKKFIDSKNTFVQDRWENLVLNFVRASIAAVSDDDWTVKVGDDLLKQAVQYNKHTAIKKTLLSITGLVIQKVQLKEFVHRAVKDLFFAADHKNEDERLGCARGLGQASATHTDPVLTHLQTIMTSKPVYASFFYTLKPTDVTMESKATALLSYGYISMLIPLKLISSRIEVSIIKNIIPVLQTPVHDIQENALRALDLVGKAVHPKRLPDFVLQMRDETMRVILKTINPKTPSSKVNIQRLKVLGLEALTTLTKLPPKFDPKFIEEILDNTLVFYSNKSKDEATDNLVMDNLNAMIASIIATDVNETTLNNLLLKIEPYVKCSDPIQRKRSIDSLVKLLKEYASLISQLGNNQSKGLKNCGRIIGELLPRIIETNIDVRRSALDAIYLTLRIQYFLKQEGKSGDLPDYIKSIGPIRKKVESTDPEEVFSIAKGVAVILAEGIEAENLQSLLETLLTTLGDVDVTGSNGSCLVFNGLISKRGKEIEQQCTTYVKSVVDLMVKYSTRETVVKGLLHGLKGIARFHLKVVINTLLNEKYPHIKQVIECFQVISTDEKLVEPMLNQLMDIVNNSQQYEEKDTIVNDRKVTQLLPSALPRSATAALKVIFEIGQVGACSKKLYATIISTLLLRLGTAHGCSSDSPTTDVKDALHNFFKCVDDDKISEKVEEVGGWKIALDKDQYPKAIKTILTLVCSVHPDLIKGIFEHVKPFVSRNYLGQRIPSTAMVSMLLKYTKNDRELIHSAVNALLSRSGTDEAVAVKIHALEGLAFLVAHPKDQMHKFITTVIGALIANLEDNDEVIILEAMMSMKQVFSEAEDQYVAPLLLNVCVRLKPSFEKSNPEIRRHSIELFGILARYSDGSLSESLIGHIHANLSTIILHLKDDNENVVKACRKSLSKLIPTLGSAELTKLFTDKKIFLDESLLFIEEKKEEKKVEKKEETKSNQTTETKKEEEKKDVIDFDDISKNFAKVWIKEFPLRIGEMVMKLTTYFKSTWVDIIVFSSLICGYILAQVNNNERSKINLRHAVSALIQLLKNPNAIVRESSSKVLGLLHES